MHPKGAIGRIQPCSHVLGADAIQRDSDKRGQDVGLEADPHRLAPCSFPCGAHDAEPSFRSINGNSALSGEERLPPDLVELPSRQFRVVKRLPMVHLQGRIGTGTPNPLCLSMIRDTYASDYPVPDLSDSRLLQVTPSSKPRSGKGSGRAPGSPNGNCACRATVFAAARQAISGLRGRQSRLREILHPVQNQLIQALTVSMLASTQASATSCGSSPSRPIFRIQPLTTAGSSRI